MTEIKTHYLRCLPQYYDAVISGDKTFEIRKNDRDFKVGDIIYLEEWEHTYTGRQVCVRVRYILKDCLFAGLMPDYVIMSIKICRSISDTYSPNMV